MEFNDLSKHIDHTQLKAFATWQDIEKLCKQAIQYKTASVCIPPAYIKKVKENFGNDLKICTVIGFPLGYSTTSVKVFETRDAISNGADEIDMVVNIGDVKTGNYDKVLEEIKAIRDASKDKVLKVIIETCYLTDEEKIKLCQLVTEAKADYIKTSTGFGSAGASIEDIKLFKANIGPEVKMKAAGGIRKLEDLKAYIELGCDRVGASATEDFYKDFQNN